MSVCCDCCVLSGRGLCVGLITRPEDCGVSECDHDPQQWGGLDPPGLLSHGKGKGDNLPVPSITLRWVQVQELEYVKDEKIKKR